ncbi:MAG TPA: MarR family winged helix-turn-helix transcriptional regulator [Thermomicrobiales bacterium]|nr:MarR family winged helix-turn-helix transcriptional regulator [Thermomicrobiales bacterium]
MDEENSVLDPMLGALLRQPFQAITARVLADLHACGYGDLRPSHLTVFQHLPAGGGRPTELAERAQMTKQSMGALVDQLVTAGYIERAADPRDGRARVLRRTERGWAVERSARASIGALEAEWAMALGAERLAQCRAFLSDLSELLDGEASDAGPRR